MTKINKKEILKILTSFSKKKVSNNKDLKKILLDSLSMMKIIINLEKFYKIKITKKFKPDSFESIENIIKLINDNKKRHKK